MQPDGKRSIEDKNVNGKLKRKKKIRAKRENKQLVDSLKEAKVAQHDMGKQLEEAKQRMEEMISDYEERVAKEKQEPTNMYEDILLMNNGSR